MLQKQWVGQVGGRGSERRTPCQVTQAGVRLSLTGVVVEVGDQADPQRVGAVQAFDDAQVAGGLSKALPETQTTVIHRQGMGVKITCQDRIEI